MTEQWTLVLIAIALFFAWAAGEGRPLWIKAVFVVVFVALGLTYRWVDEKQSAVYARIIEANISNRERTAFHCGAIAERGAEELMGACAKYKGINLQ